MDPGDIAAVTVAVGMGIAIAVIWTRDIITAREFEASRGRLHARSDSGDLLVPHWIAEYATSLLLIGAAVLVARDVPSGPVVMALAAGALGYTSVNSLGWALASSDRVPYAAPMIAGIAAAVWLGTYALIS